MDTNDVQYLKELETTFDTAAAHILGVRKRDHAWWRAHYGATGRMRRGHTGLLHCKSLSKDSRVERALAAAVDSQFALSGGRCGLEHTSHTLDGIALH